MDLSTRVSADINNKSVYSTEQQKRMLPVTVGIPAQRKRKWETQKNIANASNLSSLGYSKPHDSNKARLESASEGKDSPSLTPNATLGLRLDPATHASRRLCCEGTDRLHLV